MSEHPHPAADPSREQIEKARQRALDQHSTALVNISGHLSDVETALIILERAGSEVARHGATTGPQWPRLSAALIGARAALAGPPRGRDASEDKPWQDMDTAPLDGTEVVVQVMNGETMRAVWWLKFECWRPVISALGEVGDPIEPAAWRPV